MFVDRPPRAYQISQAGRSIRGMAVSQPMAARFATSSLTTAELLLEILHPANG